MLLLQNPTDYSINATVYFWDTTGALLHAEPVTARRRRASLVLNTATIPAVNGQSGSRSQ